MLRVVGRMIAAGLFLIAGAAQAQVAVSQVYGGGGNTGATFRNDFIELHNNGVTPVDLTGWSVQYASSTGTTWQRTNLSGSIAAGGYYLVQQAAGTGGTTNLPTPDATGTIAMSGTAGKVILVNNQTTLSGACPTGAAIIDIVGFGSAANCSETAPTAAPSNTTSILRGGNGCTDTNNNSTDFTTGTPNPRNSASAVSVCGASTPLVSVNDVSAVEGDSGTSQFFFAFGLSQPAGVGGVSVQYATANGTATDGSDYVAASGTLVIPEGSTSIAFSVTVNGDTTSEPDETFFVNIVSATGATVSDGQGQGTIQNDDVSVVQIHDIQGNGLTSPINGAAVTTEGIVTAQKFNNGFFLQTVDANVDADPNTSQGIFVFTSTAPPATATVGNRVRVTGTVTEFTPSTNLNQLSITEIVSVTSIQVISTGNPLPAPIVLTSADFGATAVPGTAEKYEGMRVSVPSATAVSGADGNITESSATSSTTGVFHVILPGVARPFREPGLSVMDVFPVPGGKNPPRFDTNQERLMVRSRGQVGASAVAIDAETTITGMVGVLDYFSGTWALLPDNGTVTVSGGKTPTAVADARYEEVTIGGFNLLRFFDEVNDSNGAPTLTAAAVDKRLTKTSIAICDYLKAPDILGVVEVENLRVLGLLADRINSTCARAPQYVPYLVQGNDQGGINVGFLVSNRALGATTRVEVLEVTQFGKNTLFTNPDNSTSLLNDRPPLMLRANVHQDNGASYPVTVFVIHNRSLNGVDDTGPGSGGWATEGHRVRAKRAEQALFVANLVHTRQQANPGEHIVLLGDFNAFEFNDGYVDVMGIVRGEEPPADQVILDVDSPITTPLVDGSELIANPAEKYSYVFEGNAQTLDHVVVNEALVMNVAGVSVDHARINADFGVHNFGVAGNGVRVSDHDPVRVAIRLSSFLTANLGLSANASPASVNVGDTATYTVVVANAGPSDAAFAAVALVFDAVVSPNVTAPAGWTCGAPVQTTTTTVTCTHPSLANGAGGTFTATVATTPALAGRSLQMAAAITSQVADPANADNSATASVAVNVSGNADMSTTVYGGPIVNGQWQGVSTAPAGGTVQLLVSARNMGPQAALQARLVLSGDAPLANAVLAAQPAGWTCTPGATAGGFEIVCDRAGAMPLRTGEFFVLNVVVPNRTGSLNLTSTASSLLNDPVAGNNTVRRTFTITGATPAPVVATPPPSEDPAPGEGGSDTQSSSEDAF